MKYVDEFRPTGLCRKIAAKISKMVEDDCEYRYMEVCGTHTMAIFRFGLREMLPSNIKLLSGPGCPVCVTPNTYLDRAIAISRLPDVIIATFGDMMRVPGSRSSLEKEKAAGRAVKIVYSTDDALEIARRNPAKNVVFMGVGFETTTPTVAASILEAKREKITNYSVLSAHKTMPAALESIAATCDNRIDGFLLPGHVSAIIGTKPYRFISHKYDIGAVVAGFEPVDILQSILMLMNQSAPKVEVQYSRIIESNGNPLARKVVNKVFEESSSEWRGIGSLKHSGLKIRKEFSDFDAGVKFKVKVARSLENKACLCGMVLKGVKTPVECKLFGKSCTPENPVGSCMVSSEGACAAYYKYGRG